MPHLILSNIEVDPNWLFPNLSPIINEIRRERRIELALEGFRWNDLARWRAQDIIVGHKPLGIRFDPVMYPDVKIGTQVILNDQDYVIIYNKELPQGYTFNPKRDYLDPLPTLELTLNKNLKQNPGWE